MFLGDYVTMCRIVYGLNRYIRKLIIGYTDNYFQICIEVNSLRIEHYSSGRAYKF